MSLCVGGRSALRQRPATCWWSRAAAGRSRPSTVSGGVPCVRGRVTQVDLHPHSTTLRPRRAAGGAAPPVPAPEPPAPLLTQVGVPSGPPGWTARALTRRSGWLPPAGRRAGRHRAYLASDGAGIQAAPARARVQIGTGRHNNLPRCLLTYNIRDSQRDGRRRCLPNASPPAPGKLVRPEKLSGQLVCRGDGEGLTTHGLATSCGRGRRLRPL